MLVLPWSSAGATAGASWSGVASLPGAPQGLLQGDLPSAGCKAAAPPCGYINPILDLDFPDKPVCTKTGGAIDLGKCIPLPAVGESTSFSGTVRWYWKLSEDGTYPPDTSQAIEITFTSVTSNPTWLPFKVEPEKYTIAAVDLLDPRNTKVDDSGPSPVLYYWFERPVNVTFTRDGLPSVEAAAKIASRDGLLETYIRGRSTPSGTTFNAAFGGEYFRFNATSLAAQSGPSNASPGLTGGAVLIAVALGGAVLVSRRSRRRRT